MIKAGDTVKHWDVEFPMIVRVLDGKEAVCEWIDANGDDMDRVFQVDELIQEG